MLNLAASPVIPYTRGENSTKVWTSMAVKQRRNVKWRVGEICRGQYLDIVLIPQSRITPVRREEK